MKTAKEVLQLNPAELGKWFKENDIDGYLDTTCIYCGKPSVQIDHVIPVSRGGSNDRTNKVPACVGCNAEKSDQTPEEWLGVPNHSIFHGNRQHLIFARRRMEGVQ